VDSPERGKSRRWLGIAAIVFAVAGSVYLWTINLAIVRDADLRRIDDLQLELMATREALGRVQGDFGFLSGASLSHLKSNDRLGLAKKASGVVLHRGSKLFVTARPLRALSYAANTRRSVLRLSSPSVSPPPVPRRPASRSAQQGTMLACATS